MNYESGVSVRQEAEPVTELNPELLLELAERIADTDAELSNSIQAFAEHGVRRVLAGEQSYSSVVEQEAAYDLSFEKSTVISVGTTALAGTVVVSPDLMRQGVNAAAGHPNFEQARTYEMDSSEPTREKLDTPGMYAQEKPEYQAYVGHAEQMIYRLMDGDASGLSGLASNYREALSVRMNQRINQFDSGEISQGEFRLEVKKMISVACTGLRDQAEASVN